MPRSIARSIRRPPDVAPLRRWRWGGRCAASFLALSLWACVGWLSAADDDPTQFAQRVGPLLAKKCAHCHGGDDPQGALDLGGLPGVVRGGDSGEIIVPGKPDESLLWTKLRDHEMPPEDEEPLSQDELESVRRWIADEAPADVARLNEANGQSLTVTQHDVIPILLRRCAPCHGARRQEAGLDLRNVAGMLRGGKSGPAMVPSRPEESLLLSRVRAAEMPPRDRLVEVSVKPLEDAEIATIERWIAAGASESPLAPDVATAAPDPLVTDRDREFWAFRPPRPVEAPTVRAAARVRNPIDAFVLQKLEAQGLTFSPEADRATLLRRACFDLTGLPPEPGEVEAFLADDSADAYERLIDRLLASPRYGERWGRQWLDLAGYADSEGKREQDLPRPQAWRYRDYVIRAFNSDKPYDLFLLEQIAGDELADYEHAVEITPEIYDNLVATGFLRMTPDATWANITGYVPDRLEVIADEMEVLGSAVFGLTLKCARCHDHKFDPLPQRDYYRLLAVFKGAYDEYDWLKPDVRPGIGPVSQDVQGGRLLPYVTTSERRDWEARQARLNDEIESIRAALEQRARELTERLVEQRLQQLPDVLRADLRAMLDTPAEQRNEVQRYLAEKFEAPLRVDRDALAASDADFKAQSDEATRRITMLESERRPEPQIQALWDRGEPAPTYIYRRGDYLRPARLVGPGVPSALTDGQTPFVVAPPWPGARSTGRRLALARWLTRPDHPLTARVLVNRVWKQHFGAGIVSTLDNFGRVGSAPSHPELLDWLAREFVRNGWRQKELQRLLMTSTTYRQSSAVTEQPARLDPDNRLLSRMPLTRLDAEQLYDAMLLIAGRLDETRFGPGDAVQSRADGLLTPVGTERGWRRLIYVSQQRKQTPTHLENFDYPQMNPNCVTRRPSTVATQALYLLNNGFVWELAERFAERVRREAGEEPSRQLECVYLMALSRPPNDAERALGLDALATLRAEWIRGSSDSGATEEVAAQQALATYCHAIFNSAAFLYID